MTTSDEPQDAAAFAVLRSALLDVPYAKMLGLEASCENGTLLGHLPFAEHLIGNPLVPALHGGVVAALLHFTAAAQLMMDMKTCRLPQIFTCTIEYLASPELRDCQASAAIVSQTRRFANIRALGWQPHSGKMIASATMQFLTNTAE